MCLCASYAYLFASRVASSKACSDTEAYVHLESQWELAQSVTSADV